jgi:hypothetical protein
MSESSPALPVDVFDVILMVSDQMATLAWQKLGLQPDLVTGKTQLDLDQAKVAIDLVAHLAHVIDSKLDESDRRQLQGLVRDLRLNYVQKSSAENN